MDKSVLTAKIKTRALELGFDGCGIAASKRLSKQETFLKYWLEKGLHATMHYMASHFDKRVDPGELVPGAKTIISVVLNYYNQNPQPEGAPLVAKYAYGTDYHVVIKNKLKQLLGFIQQQIPACTGRMFVDSAPVLDRAWAAEAGLGWIGKNTNLIIPGKGSFFFIGELIIDTELEYDTPIKDYCGSCTKCINACPTNALVVPYVLDSNRCIAYHTIENRDIIPPHFKGKFNSWIFGCDICQDVCPWNKSPESAHEKQLQPLDEIKAFTADNWKSMNEESFNKSFRNSAIKRTGYKGIKRNLDFIG
jgi:epoxyqueuosine reductase